MIIMIGIGYKIKQLRKNLNITQQELANNMHVTQASIANYESETKYPDYEKLLWLCDFFGVSTDYMLGRTKTFTNKNNNIEKTSVHVSNENEKITNYYNRLNEENRDYIRGEMVKLYREQENDAVENDNQEKIG